MFYPHPPWLTDLFLWLLGLQGIPVGGVTVWAVMFTVVICCLGIGHDQELLDVTLQKTEKETGVSSLSSYRKTLKKIKIYS